SRPLSKGRLACSGSSLRVDIERVAQNPPYATGVRQASDAPATMISASPRWMTRNASPTALAPVEQATDRAVNGPFRPCSIETTHAVMFTRTLDTKNGPI